MAVLTGGQVISDEVGLNLETSNPEQVLGSAKLIEITKDDTLIMHGNGDKSAIDERVN